MLASLRASLLAGRLTSSRITRNNDVVRRVATVLDQVPPRSDCIGNDTRQRSNVTQSVLDCQALEWHSISARAEAGVGGQEHLQRSDGRRYRSRKVLDVAPTVVVQDNFPVSEGALDCVLLY